MKNISIKYNDKEIKELLYEFKKQIDLLSKCESKLLEKDIVNDVEDGIFQNIEAIFYQGIKETNELLECIPNEIRELIVMNDTIAPQKLKRIIELHDKLIDKRFE